MDDVTLAFSISFLHNTEHGSKHDARVRNIEDPAACTRPARPHGGSGERGVLLVAQGGR